MDHRQKKRILIFLLVPVLAGILFITDDLLIRVITIILIIIYVAFIIFLRDSVRFQGGYSISEDEDDKLEKYSSPSADHDESFKIISRKDGTDVPADETYSPDFTFEKTTLKPHDLKERFEEIAYEQLPKGVGHDEQFSFVLEKMLTVVKEAYDANTAIFFWYNKNKEKLTVEKFVSNSEDISRRKFDLEDDILSKIVQNGEPELLSDISPAAESDVIRYYSSVQGIRSFVGVPLFYDKVLIAIIALDSKVGDAFGIETIYALGRFVRVITMIITIFEEKHSDNVSKQRLDGLMKFISPENNYEDEQELLRLMHGAAELFVSWDAFVFVYYDPVKKDFVSKKVINNTSLKYIGENLEIEIKGTIVGKSIKSGSPVKIDDTSLGSHNRYSNSEDQSFDGSFLAIPIIYNKQIYGVICFDSLKKNAFSNQDVQFLKSALNIFSFIIYSHSTRKLLESLISVDLQTRALNSDSFMERLTSDLIKSKDLRIPGALALIKIDNFLEQDSLFDGDPLPKVTSAVADTIAKEMTPLNLFGRLDDKLFAVYFFNTDTKKVFVWAEKVRVKIARQPIAIVSKQSTFTISIGIASATQIVDAKIVIEKANFALQKAVEKGGNSVQNIN
ncbi:MAG: sensor domain-containing diguanylate cyclase [Ignavibacteria bacterium]|nr:MAG: sensor domain-containing diguanylate cyclase [Ignavibacteria bacterium]